MTNVVRRGGSLIVAAVCAALAAAGAFILAFVLTVALPIFALGLMLGEEALDDGSGAALVLGLTPFSAILSLGVFFGLTVAFYRRDNDRALRGFLLRRSHSTPDDSAH